MNTTPHYNSLDEAIKNIYGSGVRLTSFRRLSGGDINDAKELELSNGERVFMKSNAVSNLAFFTEEARGIAALKETGAIGTPNVLATGIDDNTSFLLQELIVPARQIPNYHEVFGHELAALHKAPCEHLVNGGRFGFLSDNFIGASPQENAPKSDWISFFRECRLSPQFKRADRYFDKNDRNRITYLLDHLDRFLIEPDRPSFIHGDLWGGNYMTGADGRAWLIDPAAYVGHAEADLAMTELFGGFNPAFYSAYREVMPLAPGYNERRDIYNLYHLLNHLNLFGGSYLGSVRRILAIAS